MTEECQKKRLLERHGEDLDSMNFLFKLFDEFEPAGEDEENAFDIAISEDMTKEEVMNKALEIIAKIWKKHYLTSMTHKRGVITYHYQTWKERVISVNERAIFYTNNIAVNVPSSVQPHGR